MQHTTPSLDLRGAILTAKLVVLSCRQTKDTIFPLHNHHWDKNKVNINVQRQGGKNGFNLKLLFPLSTCRL